MSVDFCYVVGDIKDVIFVKRVEEFCGWGSCIVVEDERYDFIVGGYDFDVGGVGEFG